MTSFPCNLAAIDCGSNALRFAVARFTAPSAYRLLESRRVPVRLGGDAFASGRLSHHSIEAAIEQFQQFAARAERLGAIRLRAVATSAVRDSDNGPEFQNGVVNEAGFQLEVIDGTEEARLIKLAIASRINLASGRWLLADLGGGSVEATILNNGIELWSKSFQLGAVRLLDDPKIKQAADPESRYAIFKTLIADRLSVPDEFQASGFSYAATGGNIESLARICDATPNDLGIASIEVAQLKEIVRKLGRIGPEARCAEFRLKPDRADVIVPAGLIYLRLARQVNARQILVPFVGLKDGILLDLANGLV